MTSWEPDRYGWPGYEFPEPKMDEIYGDDYRVTFSRKTQLSVLFVAGCFLALAGLLYMGRPW